MTRRSSPGSRSSRSPTPRATQVTTGPVQRSPANPDTLVVPLRPHLPEGWYLIYWRAISVDGHPVQGAFTYAVGPNPGPAPQFPVPKVSASAKTPKLLIARWVMFLSVMSAIGLFALRMLIARPLIRRVEGTNLRALSVACVAFSVVGLIAIPVYLDFSVANDSLRSVFDLSALVPLYRVTAFGRAIVDFEICFALFCLAAWTALWLDRPQREHRSIAELASLAGALLAAAGALIIPGAAGHPAQTSPRGLTMLLDWLHLASGSVWFGGLVGLLIIWRGVESRVRVPALSVIVPRFSNVALVSAIVVAGTGVGEAIIHMPAVNALWETGFGQAILVKSGLLIAAFALASGNLLRSRPQLIAARERPEVGQPSGVPAARPDRRRDVHRRRHRVRRGRVVEPRPATAGLRSSELGAGYSRTRPCRANGQPCGLQAAGARLPEQGRGARFIRAANHQGRQAGPRRQRHARVQPPGDADATAGVPAHRNPAGDLLALRARPGDGGPLESGVPDHA